MMKTFRSLFIFLFVFNVEIKVKANELSAFTQKPVGCFEKAQKQAVNEECFVRSSKKHNPYRFQNVDYIFSKETLIKIDGSGLVLVSGLLAIKTKEHTKITTLFGEVESVGAGEYWVEVQSEKAVVTNMSGDVNVQAQGKKIQVPEKLQLSFWQANQTAKIFHGVPERVPVPLFLSQWSGLYFGEKKDFLEDVEEFKTRYSSTIEKESLLYQKVAERHLASIESRELEKQRLAQKKKDLESERKRLYFEKVFER